MSKNDMVHSKVTHLFTENDSWTSCVQFWNKYIHPWGLFCNKKYHFTKMMFQSYIDPIGSKICYKHLVNSVYIEYSVVVLVSGLF